MIPEKIGRYEILAELGRGGMATVYQAHDPRFKRHVAIKVLPASFTGEPTFKARFEREAQTIAALEFPGIVPVYDFGEENEQPYLVMRYMQGGSLYAKLREGALSLNESSQMITRLAGALDYMHARGIVHRDLKPANILFDQFANAYLSDFGIARLQEASVALTGDGMIGTPAYMSPEQARGDTDIDGRSDIYSLAAIIFEMLTGRQPYRATTPMGIAMKHVLEPVPRILEVRSDLPTLCESLILRGMAKEREERYQTASEMAADLTKIALSAAETPPPTLMDVTELAQPKAPQPIPPPATPAPHTEAEVEGSAELHMPAPVPPAEAEAPAEIRQPAPVPVAESAAPLPRRPRTPVPAARPASRARLPRKPRSKLPVLPVVIGGIGLLCLAIFAIASLRGVRFMQEFLDFRARVLGTNPTQPPLNLDPILYRDDFSDVDSGWEHYQGPDGLRDYEHDAYHIIVDIPNRWFVATPRQHFSDVNIRVDAAKVGGPEDSYFGIICRFQDLDNYYFLIISSNGRYGIGKSVDGKPSFIGQDHMLYHDNIHRGEAGNLIQALCVENRLALFANDIQLAMVEDSTFIDGNVGLLVGNADDPGANIVFDNFIVAQP